MLSRPSLSVSSKDSMWPRLQPLASWFRCSRPAICEQQSISKWLCTNGHSPGAKWIRIYPGIICGTCGSSASMVNTMNWMIKEWGRGGLIHNRPRTEYYLWLTTKVNSKWIPTCITRILDKHLIFTILYQIYYNIKKKYIFWHRDVKDPPTSTKSLIDNIKQFKSVVRNYLHAHSFHTVSENFNEKYIKLKLIFYLF